VRHNARILGPVITSADLVWIKVPASNALLGGWLAARAGIPRFGYVAGSARAVARGRGLGLPAQAIGLAYDLAGWAAGGRGRVVVGEGIVNGHGIVTSLVEEEEIRHVIGKPWPIIPWRLRLSWAGRLAPGKGLEALLDAVAMLAAEEHRDRIELVVLGDGPSRSSLQAHATRLGIADRVHWLGYVADRLTYLETLEACDVFVFPSPAEGFPKVALDAMAVGLPVLATPTGSLRELAAADLILPVRPSAEAVVAAVRGLTAEPGRAARLRDAGAAFAAKHTRTAEAERLVNLWRDHYPRLPWPART
jgi:glycosyltransferase involved in cell wall biosynthesis